MSNLAVRLLLLVSLLAQGLTAIAGGSSKLCQAPCPDSGAWELSVGLGLGISTNPLKGGGDIPLIVRPRLSYYGERVFLDNYEAGIMLWESGSQQVNLFVLPSLEQLYFRRWHQASAGLSLDPSFIKDVEVSDPNDKAAPLRHRHTSALGGFEYNASLDEWAGGVEFNWQVLEELSGYHAGREMRLAISSDFLSYWRASLGANFQSRAYIDYYFGVAASEATPAIPQYTPPSGGWSTLLRLEYLKPVSQHFAIKGSAAVKIFSPELAASPLLEESSVYSLFIGGVYYF